jgi:hypothetical protein
MAPTVVSGFARTPSTKRLGPLGFVEQAESAVGAGDGVGLNLGLAVGAAAWNGVTGLETPLHAAGSAARTIPATATTRSVAKGSLRMRNS